MESTITATHLAKHLSDVLNRVRYRGEQFLVERNGEVIAKLVPPLPLGVTAAELARRLAHVRWPDKGFFDELEAIQASQPLMPEPPAWPC